MGDRGELVLVLTGDLELDVAGLGERAHRLVRRHVVQAVEGHVVQDLDRAVLVAGPALGQQVRGLRHGLLAARDDDLGVARADRLVGERDGGEPGQAHLVDVQRVDALGDTGRERRLPRGHLTVTGGQNLTHDHLVDGLGGDVPALEGGADRDAAQLGSGQGGQASLQAAERGTGTGDDDGAGGVGGHGTPSDRGETTVLAKLPGRGNG